MCALCRGGVEGDATGKRQMGGQEVGGKAEYEEGKSNE